MKNQMDTLTKSTSTLLALVIGLIPVLIVPAFGDWIYMPKIMAIYCLVFGLLLYNLRPLTQYFSKKPALSLPAKLTLLYLLCITVTLPFSTDILHSLEGRSFRLESYSAIIFYGLLMLLGSFFYRYQDWHFRLYGLGVSLVSIYGILQRYGFDFLEQDPLLYGGKFSAYSTIGNPNFLGAFLTLALPVMVYLFVKREKLYLLPAGLVYYCLLCSNTRGSWIGSCVAFVALGIFLWQEKKNRPLLFVVTGVFALLTGIFILTNSGFLPRLFTVAGAVSNVVKGERVANENGYARIFIWEKTIELIKMRPLTGFGIECLDRAMETYFHQDIIDYVGYSLNIDKAHNEYLHIAVVSGIPAACAYLAMEVSVLVTGFKARAKNPMILPLLASILGYMVAACFNISVVSVAPVFWVFCGMVVGMEKPEQL